MTAVDGFKDLLRQVVGGSVDCDAVAYARRVLRFDADASQAEILAAGSTGGAPMRLLLCCSRQWGKSTTAAALITHRAVTQRGALMLCVAPTLRQSAELVRKVIEFLKQARVEFQGGRLGCELRNGSGIVAVPGQEANVRGFSAPSLILIDEAARVPDLLYKAIRPMLVVGRGDLALLSTPFGELGFFWQEWAHGGERWMRVEGKATDCSRFSADELDEERRAQTAEWFSQEYLCSFVGLENQAFRKAWLEAAVAGGIEVNALNFKLKGGHAWLTGCNEKFFPRVMMKPIETFANRLSEMSTILLVLIVLVLLGGGGGYYYGGPAYGGGIGGLLLVLLLVWFLFGRKN